MMRAPAPVSGPITATQALVLFLLLMSAGLSVALSMRSVLSAAALAPLVLVTVAALLWSNHRPRPTLGTRSSSWLSIIPLLGTAWLVAWTYSGPNILPVHDPIAIPWLASHLAKGELPSLIYPHGSFAHAYPPGAPLLFAPVWATVSPAQAIMLIKYITLTALVLIPATWGWLLHRSFTLSLNFPLWIAICCLAFWGLERTIGFALPYAGKTALIWALCLCPILLGFMLDCARRASPWQWGMCSLALFGLVMLNYSMAHLAATCLAGIWLASYERGRPHWREAMRLLVMLTLTAAMVLLVMRDAVSDPRAGGFQFVSLPSLRHMLGLFLERATPVVYFQHADTMQTMHRGALQLGGWVLAWWLAPRVAPDAYVRSLRACLIIILLILLAGLGIIPSGISLDYARWILWPLQAMWFAVVIGMAVHVMLEKRGGIRAIATAVTALLIGTSFALIREDTPSLKQVVRNDAVPIQRLREEAQWLEDQAGPGACQLVGESHVTGDNLSVVHVDRIFSYVPLLSRCRFLNGSWVDKGPAEARAWSGLPTSDYLSTKWAPQGTLLLIGTPEHMQPYMTRLSKERAGLAWEMLRSSGDSSVWRAVRPL